MANSQDPSTLQHCLSLVSCSSDWPGSAINVSCLGACLNISSKVVSLIVMCLVLIMLLLFTQHIGRDFINMGLAAASAASLVTFCATGDAHIAALALGTGELLLMLQCVVFIFGVLDVLPTRCLKIIQHGIHAHTLSRSCLLDDSCTCFYLSIIHLQTGVFSSGALGLHMTSSIGGADMPVVITLLNSYSGEWTVFSCSFSSCCCV